MRFTWLEALCVLAIAIMMIELHPPARSALLPAASTASSPAWKGGLVADGASKRAAGGHLRRER
jgi:hypothetical protein